MDEDSLFVSLPANCLGVFHADMQSSGGFVIMNVVFLQKFVMVFCVHVMDSFQLISIQFLLFWLVRYAKLQLMVVNLHFLFDILCLQCVYGTIWFVIDRIIDVSITTSITIVISFNLLLNDIITAKFSILSINRMTISLLQSVTASVWHGNNIFNCYAILTYIWCFVKQFLTLFWDGAIILRLAKITVNLLGFVFVAYQSMTMGASIVYRNIILNFINAMNEIGHNLMKIDIISSSIGIIITLSLIDELMMIVKTRVSLVFFIVFVIIMIIIVLLFT